VKEYGFLEKENMNFPIMIRKPIVLPREFDSAGMDLNGKSDDPS